ncbi:BON domain-containing protein [Thiococcus pfennigii]|uniref:BON domain-containing protein n=1 Tax=Thiococcus pfennigii TaxID=1057 RepID=UPI0019049585|nr:BON domain-containing protein [Thiococcus pfennigii]MBK1732388.1 transporter [Thiococcus pfennigii]
MNSYTRFSLVASLALAFAFGSVGCEQEGPAEETGQDIDQATEKTGEKMEAAKESVGDAAERTGQYMSDAMITAKIKAGMLADPLLEVLRIEVTTTNGAVKLSGVIDSQESIDRSIEIANGIEGVRSVESALVVTGAE